AQSVGGSSATTFYSLEVAKTNGTVTLATQQELVDVLTLTSGILNANGNLTLLSTASGDARIAPITGTGSITGAVTVQRYLPNGTGTRVYRYLASPVTDAKVSDWKDD